MGAPNNGLQYFLSPLPFGFSLKGKLVRNRPGRSETLLPAFFEFFLLLRGGSPAARTERRSRERAGLLLIIFNTSRPGVNLVFGFWLQVKWLLVPCYWFHVVLSCSRFKRTEYCVLSTGSFISLPV